MIRVRTDGETSLSRLVKGTLTVSTGRQAFFDLTEACSRWLSEIGARDGVLNLMVAHTTASLTIQENADDDVQRDLLTALAGLAPEEARYRHTLEGPDDMPGHIKAMLSDTTLTLPVGDAGLELGTWQAIYLIEHRVGRHDRTVRLSYLGR
ncbi:secondary thiamine-phosphate synthase enzyme YjbQ [Acuticoccus sp. M5D2P5]|uniref:secondary thiamine-phosphate synthase enzyme YjbQ n=1 Tax=Acuticoccus kalidii TaxID=2910977 RepID=UPI001F0141D4|nr:secondary thiamine-phosphate synthase enzyme YjbQ [Acuticoccus kalidii]MCF3934730.1 secondary thiamine-phosphate synthase enzyme YjbQ [Acuticoccus kalidii]